MRTVHESTDLLVVAETANGMRICGGAVAIAGAVLLAAGARANNGATSIVGGIMLVTGASLLLLPAITTVSFNRGADRLTVARRRL